MQWSPYAFTIAIAIAASSGQGIDGILPSNSWVPPPNNDGFVERSVPTHAFTTRKSNDKVSTTSAPPSLTYNTSPSISPSSTDAALPPNDVPAPLLPRNVVIEAQIRTDIMLLVQPVTSTAASSTWTTTYTSRATTKWTSRSTHTETTATPATTAPSSIVPSNSLPSPTSSSTSLPHPPALPLTACHATRMTPRELAARPSLPTQYLTTVTMFSAGHKGSVLLMQETGQETFYISGTHTFYIPSNYKDLPRAPTTPSTTAAEPNGTARRTSGMPVVDVTDCIVVMPTTAGAVWEESGGDRSAKPRGGKGMILVAVALMARNL